MSALWAIGTEVECISTYPYEGSDMPKLCAKYKIAEVLHHVLGVTLQFTTLRFEGDEFFLPGFSSECFRPVQKRATSIECFRALLHPSEDEIAYVELEDSVADLLDFAPVEINW